MCGWLPLRTRIEAAAIGKEDMDEEENLFEDSDPESLSAGTTVETSRLVKAARYLSEELQVSSESGLPVALEFPVFIGHGSEDEKAPVQRGREAADLLRSLDLDVRYSEYEGLTPWYSGSILYDIVSFPHEKTRLQPSILTTAKISDC